MAPSQIERYSIEASVTRRIAWFSPLPPVRSGIAADSAELLKLLGSDFTIDAFDEPRAHDFVWKHRREPYDLVVYQMGNSHHHDYIWAYMAVYPGLVALHDPRLHQARARHLLTQGRADDYRAEFQYNHPDAPADFAEYAVVGLGGTIYHFYSMLRIVVRTARMVAVHNPRIATQLREEFPDAAIAAIRLGKVPLVTHASMRSRQREILGIPETSTLFAVFGKITPEKRINAILQALNDLVGNGHDGRLLLAGDTADWPTLSDEIRANGVADRVHLTGHIEDDEIGAWLSAADVCLCLRWPTALESSGSWIHCTAAAKPTVISDLAHLVDIPTLEPYTWRAFPPGTDSVAVRIDLLDETNALRLALNRLATDSELRNRLGQSGLAYFNGHHTIYRTADDYRRIIAEALTYPIPHPTDLPAHLTEDFSDRARGILARFGFVLEDFLPIQTDD